MNPEVLPRSLSGEPLFGDRAVRFVFMDEAGTSETEPVTVVVGIVAHADGHVMVAERLLEEVLGGVPDQFREGFHFHATDIWNNKKYHDDWRMTDRLALLGKVMAIPRTLGMAISVAMVRKGCFENLFQLEGLTHKQWEHIFGFMQCLARADKYIREYAHPSEVGTAIAEDVPEMQQFLRETHKMLDPKLGWNGVLSKKGVLNETTKDVANRFIGQESETRLTRIRKTIHFAKKGEEPLLQIADACAFGFRRFFSELDHGPRLIHAILGGVPDITDFRGPSSHMLYFFHPPKEVLPQQFFAMP